MDKTAGGQYSGKPSKGVKQPGWNGLIHDASEPQNDQGNKRDKIGEVRRPFNKDRVKGNP